MLTKSPRNRGFTLIECVATLLLLSLMAVVAVSVASLFRWKSEQSALTQTDLLTAASCMERVRAVYKKEGVTSLFKNYSSIATSCNGRITLTPLKTDQPPENNSNYKNIISNLTPDTDQTTCDATSYFCLVTVKSGSTELHYVVGKDYTK